MLLGVTTKPQVDLSPETSAVTSSVHQSSTMENNENIRNEVAAATNGATSQSDRVAAAILTGARPKTTLPSPKEPFRYLAEVDEEIALAYDEQQLMSGDEMEGYVTSGEEWVNFYFQCTSSQEILQDVLHSMNQLYDNHDFPSITETVAFTLGSPCAARFSKDNRWYRARLKDISYSIVEFVDYGNQQMCNLANVKPLTRSLAELVPPLAYHCKLTTFQNPLLPSFGGNDAVKIIVQNKHEPYEVSVQVLNQRQTVPGRAAAPVPHPRQVNPLAASGESVENRRRTTPQGLTLPPAPAVASSSKFNAFDDEDDEIERMKKLGRKTRTVTTGGKLAITGAPGSITQIYATCGQITPEGPYRSNIMDFNSQETTLNNGVLHIDNLTRIFKLHDRFVCNARFEDPLPNGIQKNFAPAGFYQVTNMEPIQNKNVLISHATVTFVTKGGATLYVRSIDTYVFAPVSTFPPGKADCSLLDRVQIGRTVVVRALPAEKFLDLQVNADWVAVAVEFLGPIQEHQGWMYFVRENYSVIITDGGIGIGYVFVANQFINDMNVKQDQWYGMRVIFSACTDVPDKDNRYGIRWRGLRVTIMPEHSKGAYKYPGIYRPIPIYFGDGPGASTAASKKFDDDKEEGDLELPEEAVEEMRLMGKDVIGMNRLTDSTRTKNILQPITENLLNEREEVPQNLLFAAAAAAATSTVQESSEIEITMVNDNVDGDLLGLIDVASTFPPPVAQQPAANQSTSDLLSLWEGCEFGSDDLHPPIPEVLSTPPLIDSEPAVADDRAVDAKLKDVGCQIEKSLQITEEMRQLKSSPELLAKVVAYVATLPQEVQHKFYQLMAEASKTAS